VTGQSEVIHMPDNAQTGQVDRSKGTTYRELSRRNSPRTGLLARSDSPDSPHIQVRNDINTSAFCRTYLGRRESF